jgi:RNA polymerase sigma-B factor
MSFGGIIGERSEPERKQAPAYPAPGQAPPASDAAATDRATAEQRAARSAEDRRLLERYHRDADQAAREELVERFLPLARQLARRYQRGGEQLDDLVQVASLGLLKAIDRFDPERETAFSSFAVPTILGELKRHFRDKGWAVRVPRDLQELAVKVERVGDEMSRELGRAPTAAEIGERVDVSPEQVLEAREAAAAYRAVSLDRPRGEETEEGDAFADVFGVEDPGFAQAEQAATVESLMVVLSDREREVLRLRFEEDLTQSEIGERVGVSQMHVSRLIRQSIARLRAEAAE